VILNLQKKYSKLNKYKIITKIPQNNAKIISITTNLQHNYWFQLIIKNTKLNKNNNLKNNSKQNTNKEEGMKNSYHNDMLYFG